MRIFQNFENMKNNSMFFKKIVLQKYSLLFFSKTNDVYESNFIYGIYLKTLTLCQGHFELLKNLLLYMF